MNVVTIQKQISILFALFLVVCLIFLAMLSLPENQNNPTVKRIIRGHRRNHISREDTSSFFHRMTFDYINTMFNLPDMYLKTVLDIQDVKYPNVTFSAMLRRLEQTLF